MEGAEEELESRSKFLDSLIRKKKAIEQQEQHDCLNVRVRASDMPLPLQNRAFRCARDQLDSMPSKLDSKRLPLALKKILGSNIIGLISIKSVTYDAMTGKELEVMDKLIQKVKDPFPSNSYISPHQKEYTIQEIIELGPPHEALFLVLPYLPLFELLAMGGVCMSLRDALHKDVLPWLNIIVERPLNLRLTDEILKNFTSKAIGRLKTLVLMNCIKVTDDGLQSVIDRNHGINKLHIPACTSLTPGGVIGAVKKLSEHNHSLKSLRINGIYNIKKEELDTLRSYLQMNMSQEVQQMPHPNLFHQRNLSIFCNKSEPLIDVDICPMCKDVRMVYDCPREACKRKNKKLMQPSAGCKGCNLCILRCEECGGCLESEEIEETACGDSLCSECWLQLPKCNFCNRPYCNQHAHRQYKHSSSSGFVCDVCHEKYGRNFT